jgi:prophage DNA circulation protein
MGLSDSLAAMATAIEGVGDAIVAEDEALQNQITTLGDTVSNIALVRGLFNALVVSTTGLNNNVNVTALEMVLKDGNGHVAVIANVNVNATTKPAGQAGAGAGSLDTGNFASNTWYALYVAYSAACSAVRLHLLLSRGLDSHRQYRQCVPARFRAKGCSGSLQGDARLEHAGAPNRSQRGGR